MIPYTSPEQNLVQLNISPIGKPNLFTFFSDGAGSINFCGGYIYFSTTPIGGNYSANDGDIFVFDSNIITFRDTPSINDLQAGLNTARNFAERLYQILKRHAQISLKYDFEYVLTPNQEAIYWLAKVSGNEGKPLDSDNNPQVPYFTGLAQTTCTSNTYVPINIDLNNYEGQSSNYRGQVEIFTSTSISGLESLFTTTSQRSILLQRQQLGFDGGSQIPMEFDTNLFMRKDLDTSVDFTQTIAYLNDGALRKYQINQGDFVGNTYVTQSSFLNRYQVHNSFNLTDNHQNRLPNTGLKLIDFLTDRGEHQINPSQYNTLSFIWHYVPFDLSEPLLNFQNTSLWLSYDLLFEDGTTSLNNVQPNITLAINSGQFTQDVSLYLINYQTLETTSRIKSITFTLYEYLPTDLISNSRQVTNPITFHLNNDLRCYQVDDNDPINDNNREQTQLYYMNSLGGFDTLFTHEATKISHTTESNTYQYSYLNRDVFKINDNLTYSITSDQLDEAEWKQITNNLMNSTKVWIKMKDFDQTPCYIVNSTNDYNNQTKLTKLSLLVALKEEQNNLTK